MFKVLQKNGKSDLGIIKVCIRITWEMTYCTCSRKPTKMANDTYYPLSVEKDRYKRLNGPYYRVHSKLCFMNMLLSADL